MRRLSPDEHPEIVKLVIIGNSGVGKSNILMRFCDKRFNDSYVATIGVDFKIKTIEVDGLEMRLQLWDTAGQERYKNLTKAYYKGAAGIIVTCAINDHKSFEDMESWMKQITETVGGDPQLIILCNKKDLEKEDRKVSSEELQKLSKKYKVSCYEVSAKDGTNIDNAFMDLATRLKRTLFGTACSDSKIARQSSRSCTTILLKKNQRFGMQPVQEQGQPPKSRCC